MGQNREKEKRIGQDGQVARQDRKQDRRQDWKEDRIIDKMFRIIHVRHVKIKTSLFNINKQSVKDIPFQNIITDQITIIFTINKFCDPLILQTSIYFHFHHWKSINGLIIRCGGNLRITHRRNSICLKVFALRVSWTTGVRRGRVSYLPTVDTRVCRVCNQQFNVSVTGIAD